MRKLLIALLFLVGVGARAVLGDVVADGVKAELTRERKRLTADSKSLAELSRRLESALNQLVSASRAVADASGAREPGPEDIARREEALSETEQEVRSLLDRRRLLADRVIERRRSIAVLEAELQARKIPDLLSGRWVVTLDPGEQRGVFRFSLEGTIVSGEYTLEGGYSGSLRGTLVNDRLRIERVDSRLGFSTVYHGRLTREGAAIAGTWEATTFGGGAPGAGRWRAVREEEREEAP